MSKCLVTGNWEWSGLERCFQICRSEPPTTPSSFSWWRGGGGRREGDRQCESNPVLRHSELMTAGRKVMRDRTRRPRSRPHVIFFDLWDCPAGRYSATMNLADRDCPDSASDVPARQTLIPIHLYTYSPKHLST